MHTTTLPNGLAIFHRNLGETRALYREIFEQRCYLRHGVQLPPGSVILDVGANIGMASLFFGQHCPGCRIHSFEPVPAVFDVLVANIHLHQLPARAHRIALSSHGGDRGFVYYPHNTVMSGFHADPAQDAQVTARFMLNSGFEAQDLGYFIDQKFRPEHLVCPCTTVSAFCAAEHISSIDLLKIDVEKAELEVLRGVAPDDWPKVRQIVLEVHDIDGRLADVLELLAAQGFGTRVVTDPLLSGIGLHDVIALRPRA